MLHVDAVHTSFFKWFSAHLFALQYFGNNAVYSAAAAARAACHLTSELEGRFNQANLQLRLSLHALSIRRKLLCREQTSRPCGARDPAARDSNTYCCTSPVTCQHCTTGCKLRGCLVCWYDASAVATRARQVKPHSYYNGHPVEALHLHTFKSKPHKKKPAHAELSDDELMQASACTSLQTVRQWACWRSVLAKSFLQDASLIGGISMWAGPHCTLSKGTAVGFKVSAESHKQKDI